MYSYFYFKGSFYEKGSLVHIHEKYKKDFKFCSCLVFEGYDEKTGVCCCHSMLSCWEKYEIPVDKLNDIIEDVTPAYKSKNNNSSSKIEDKYIEGMISAWIWYILIMVFALFAKDPGAKIYTWIAASFIFFYWRHKKKNGE